MSRFTEFSEKLFLKNLKYGRGMDSYAAILKN